MKRLLLAIVVLAAVSAGADQIQNCATGRTVSGTLASTLATTDSTAVIAAQGANAVVCLKQVIVTNSDASVGTVVKVLDGSTAKIRNYAASAGGGFSLDLSQSPICGTANTAWNIQAETTSAELTATFVGCPMDSR